MTRLKLKQKDFFYLAHIAAKERAFNEIYFEKKPLEKVRTVEDEVKQVMRAFRYVGDNLDGICGKFNGNTDFTYENCVEMPPWKWPKDKEIPKNQDELKRAILQTPVNQLKIYCCGDDEDFDGEDIEEG